MAQRRMISRRITESSKILALKGDDRARFVYTALLPYTDKAGRVNVNPHGLKGTIFEGFEWSSEEIEWALHALARVGLITLYRSDRHKLLAEFANFEEFNKPHPKEADSELPGPEDASVTVVKAPGNLPGNVPEKEIQGSTLTLTQTRSEVVKEEVTQKIASEATDGSLQLYMDLWNTNRGALPAIEGLGDDRQRALKKLLKRHRGALPELFRDAVRAVASNEFWVTNRYGFDNLVPSKVQRYAEQWRHSGAGLTSGDMRLARTAALVANAIGGLDDRPN